MIKGRAICWKLALKLLNLQKAIDWKLVEIAKRKNELYDEPPKTENHREKYQLLKTKMQKDWEPNADQSKFTKTEQDCKAPISETIEPQKNIYGRA